MTPATSGMGVFAYSQVWLAPRSANGMWYAFPSGDGRGLSVNLKSGLFSFQARRSHGPLNIDPAMPAGNWARASASFSVR